MVIQFGQDLTHLVPFVHHLVLQSAIMRIGIHIKMEIVLRVGL